MSVLCVLRRACARSVTTISHALCRLLASVARTSFAQLCRRVRRNSHPSIKRLRECQATRETPCEIRWIKFRIQAARAANHAQKHFQVSGLRSEAQPLRLVFVLVRAVSEQLGHLRVDPRQGVWKRSRVYDANLGPIAEGDDAGLAASLLIEGEDKGAIKGRGVKRAGCVAKMMIERQQWNPLVFRQQTENPLVIQLGRKFADGPAFVISARDRSRCEKARTECRPPRPQTPRAAGHGDGADVRPCDPSALQAKTYGRAAGCPSRCANA